MLWFCRARAAVILCFRYSFGLVLLQLSIDEPLIDYVTRHFRRSVHHPPDRRGAKPRWMEIGRAIVMEHWRPPAFEGAPETIQVCVAVTPLSFDVTGLKTAMPVSPLPHTYSSSPRLSLHCSLM